MKKNSLQLVYPLVWVIALLLFGQNEAAGQDEYTHLVWADEFEADGTPDPAKWGFDIGGDGWGNNELQYYTNRTSNVVVEGGFLIITARKEAYSGNGYTSARITSRSKGDWLYGRIEIRAKLPEGTGTWPAIWMLPTDWAYGGWPASGEIDIMEHVGYNQGTVHGTIHTQAYNGMIGTQRGDEIYVSDVHTAFHVYAIEWEADSIYWYVDDERYFSYPNYGTGFERWPFDKRFHLLMNIAVGGNWGGQEGVDDSIFPQTLTVDYVRVYQKFQQQPVKGPVLVDGNQEGITYSVAEYPGAVYTWTFPAGVELISGQGENIVVVNWGEDPGTISVEQTYNTKSYTSSLEVEVVRIPESDTLIIRGNEKTKGNWEVKAGSGNSITIEHED